MTALVAAAHDADQTGGWGANRGRVLAVRRKWRVISHPLNTNPFPGSFLNYKGRMRLIGVTMQTLTLLEFEGAFDTEHMVRLRGTRPLQALELIWLDLRGA